VNVFQLVLKADDVVMTAWFNPAGVHVKILSGCHPLEFFPIPEIRFPIVQIVPECLFPVFPVILPVLGQLIAEEF